jgi:3-deoxy-alpha-D-manno-octulosonate 8-oxidase
LDEIISPQRDSHNGFIIFLVDDVFKSSPLIERIPRRDSDLLLWANVDNEPKTAYVDLLTQEAKAHSDKPPAGVIGIGGGSTLDLAKAVSLMLTNDGSSADYQGWDLVRNPGVYHVGIPTLAGTGAEVSRTTVLTGPEKKLGINSDFTLFDQIILDPELLSGVPVPQRFYTGMDCYIHCVESLTGNFLNTFSQSYGEKALHLCQEVFLDQVPDSDDKLMMASYFGGLSIGFSQVGVCHALSYGLSFILDLHHGIGNSIAFNQLEEFYSEGVSEFREMMNRHDISLPQNVTADLDPQDMEKMIDVALVLEPLWEHALGPDWKTRMPRERIKELYLRM